MFPFNMGLKPFFFLNQSFCDCSFLSFCCPKIRESFAPRCKSLSSSFFRDDVLMLAARHWESPGSCLKLGGIMWKNEHFHGEDDEK
jgi:hypothetical protein